jgi:hypothetical protein
MSATEKPILFSGEMVRAILAGRKTQTRRKIKSNRGKIYDVRQLPIGGKWYAEFLDETVPIKQSVGWGDVLWVRETWGSRQADHPLCKNGRKPQVGDELFYRANPADDYQWGVGKPSQGSFVWRPSIHMPRWASRLTLTVTRVWAERLRDISESDARAEGIIDGGCLTCGNPEPCECKNPKPAPIEGFVRLWEAVNGKDSWCENPWVWVYQFEVWRLKNGRGRCVTSALTPGCRSFSSSGADAASQRPRCSMARSTRSFQKLENNL